MLVYQFVLFNSNYGPQYSIYQICAHINSNNFYNNKKKFCRLYCLFYVSYCADYGKDYFFYKYAYKTHNQYLGVRVKAIGNTSSTSSHPLLKSCTHLCALTMFFLSTTNLTVNFSQINVPSIKKTDLRPHFTRSRLQTILRCQISHKYHHCIGNESINSACATS